MNSIEAALAVKNLRFSAGRTQILNGIDLKVLKGERVGLIGPNGSGKTTFFNCICGFNDSATGEILFGNKDISSLRADQRAEHGLGRLFQNFGIFRQMTVIENIVVALEGKQKLGFFSASAAHKKNCDKAMEILATARLAEKAKEKAGALSGGQLRLLEIARLIAFGAKLLLLDEPTAGVSPKMKEEIITALQKLNEKHTTTIVIEHDINFIEMLCERIVVLDSGAVAMDGRVSEVRSDPYLQEIYFGRKAAQA